MTSFITSRMTALATTPHAWLLAAAVCLLPATAWGQAPCQAPGTANTACGQGALFSNVGVSNTASGAFALYSNTTGIFNTASGAYTLLLNTTGFSNTASGESALYSNTTGSSNTASGKSALYSNTTGSSNTASGRSALYSNTTGNYNTASGRNALFVSTTGDNNTAMGFEALLNLAAGSNNIALGYRAGKNTTSGNNNIYIGNYGINGPEGRAIRIGRNNVHLKTYIYGIAGTPLSGASVVIQPGGRLGVVASSARYKTDIKAVPDDVAAKLARLRPVTYRYKTEPKATHYGLIAEEVAKVMPEIVVRDEQSRPETVQYLELIPLLVQQWKAQQAENARQRVTIARLERQAIEVARQGAELAELRRLLTARHAAIHTGGAN